MSDKNRDTIAAMFLGNVILYFILRFGIGGSFDTRHEHNGFRLEVCLQGNSKNPLVLEMYIGEQNDSYINVILLPTNLMHQGLGKNIILHTYNYAKSIGNRLFISGMVNSFYSRMVLRGAIPRSNDMVEITDETDLTYHRPTT